MVSSMVIEGQSTTAQHYYQPQCTVTANANLGKLLLTWTKDNTDNGCLMESSIECPLLTISRLSEGYIEHSNEKMSLHSGVPQW